MKNIAENRPLACIVLAIVILATLLIGGGNALKGKADAVTAVFTKSGDSISYELTQMADSAELMASIAQSADEADMALVAAVTGGVDALRSAASVSEKYAASVALRTAVENLYSGASKLKLSETDAGDLEYNYKNFASAHMSLDQYPEYNEAVEAFNKVKGGFPAGLISLIRGIRDAEPFGA